MAEDEVCGCYVAGLDNVGGDHAEICLLGRAEEELESLRAALREAEAATVAETKQVTDGHYRPVYLLFLQLERLPEQRWTRHERDRWLAAMTAMVDLLVDVRRDV